MQINTLYGAYTVYFWKNYLTVTGYTKTASPRGRAVSYCSQNYGLTLTVLQTVGIFLVRSHPLEDPAQRVSGPKTDYVEAQKVAELSLPVLQTLYLFSVWSHPSEDAAQRRMLVYFSIRLNFALWTGSSEPICHSPKGLTQKFKMRIQPSSTSVALR